MTKFTCCDPSQGGFSSFNGTRCFMFLVLAIGFGMMIMSAIGSVHIVEMVDSEINDATQSIIDQLEEHLGREVELSEVQGILDDKMHAISTQTGEFAAEELGPKGEVNADGHDTTGNDNNLSLTQEKALDETATTDLENKEYTESKTEKISDDDWAAFGVTMENVAAVDDAVITTSVEIPDVKSEVKTELADQTIEKTKEASGAIKGSAGWWAQLNQEFATTTETATEAPGDPEKTFENLLGEGASAFGGIGSGLAAVGAVGGSIMHHKRKNYLDGKVYQNDPEEYHKNGKNKVSLWTTTKKTTNWAGTILIIAAIGMFTYGAMCGGGDYGVKAWTSVGGLQYASFVLLGLGTFIHFNTLDFGTWRTYRNRNDGNVLDISCNPFNVVGSLTKLARGVLGDNEVVDNEVKYDGTLKLEDGLDTGVRVGRQSVYGVSDHPKVVEMSDLSTSSTSSQLPPQMPQVSQSQGSGTDDPTAARRLSERRRRLGAYKISPLMQALVDEIAKCEASSK